jgi:membrane-bound serine protease (ClpP class)
VNQWWQVLVVVLLGCVFSFPSAAQEDAAPAIPAKVLVIPMREQIAKPELYILRRGLKDAIDQGFETVVLDMNTPGGQLDVTFDILQALEKFPGKTVTYINTDAVSAGAFISAGTDEIYFAPGGVIGAAAPVMAGGGDLNETMKAKTVSYLRARARAVSGEHPYRGMVISAMIDESYELKIGDEVIKPAGELLSLTASEAVTEYGDPPQPLLGAGIAAGVEELVERLHPGRRTELTRLEITWSEKIAQHLTAWSPLLLAVGLVLLFIEFKTPGFGVFGASGGLALAAVFFGHYTAGLSGHEPAIVFFLGVLLVAIELIFFPGIVFVALTGGLLMLGSLVLSMADLWPDQPLTIAPEVFVGPLLTVMVAVIIAAAAFLLLLRFMPKGGPWGRMVLEASIGGTATQAAREGDPLIGMSGVAATALYPAGQVVIGGKRYEARLATGSAAAGTPVVVTRRIDFGLEVEVLKS